MSIFCLFFVAFLTNLLPFSKEKEELESKYFTDDSYIGINNYMASKESKKIKTRLSLAPETDNLGNELKMIIKSLNDFLKKYFDRSTIDVKEYASLVKDYFIEESTNSNYNCLIGSLFSKISNMLQPFIQSSPNVCNSLEDSLKEQISLLTHHQERSTRKMKRLYEDLHKYKETANKLTNFVYMLRVNNIDVDTLYEKGCQNHGKAASIEKEFDFDINSHTNELKKTEVDLSNFITR